MRILLGTVVKQVGDWFEQRLQLADYVSKTMEHPVPRQTASWAYVFGSAALTSARPPVLTRG